LIPPYPGLFSALGLLSADQVYSSSRSAYTLLTPNAAPGIDAVFGQMEQALRDQMGPGGESVEFVRSFDGRLFGQSWETPFVPVSAGAIDEAAVAAMIASFHDAYE